MMNFGKKLAVGVASAALVASMGAMAPAAVAANDSTVANPGFVDTLNRLGGMDRISTSLKVADAEFAGRPNNRGARPAVLYITSMADANLVDAASAGMLQDGPIAYVANNSYIAEAVGEHFSKGGGYSAIKKVVAIGGEGAVSDATLKAVAGKIGANVATARLGGKDRYETSVAIAKHIYDQALLKDKNYKDHAGIPIVTNSSNLRVVYLANGANEHVVDSMVAGTLDNGPVLLVQPDGKIPEVVAEFIKKSLPEQFAALGGAETVKDSTVAEAWLIKTLANKWETSSDIPNLYRDKEKLKKLVYGIDPKTDRDITSPAFMGLQGAIQSTQAIANDWNNRVAGLQNEINKALNDAAESNTKFGTKTDGFYHGVLTGHDSSNRGDDNGARIHWALVALYGNLANTATGAINESVLTISSFKTDPSHAGSDESQYRLLPAGFDYSEIEGSKAYKDAYNAGVKDLNDHWGEVVNPGLYTNTAHKLTNQAAIASQTMIKDNLVSNSDAAGDGVSVNSSVALRVIADLAAYTNKQEQAWYKEFKAQLEGKEQQLRVEQDKIAVKKELRLGGKDRFETAALIANQYGNLYGGVVGAAGDFDEVYIANGLRLADSLTASQLNRGPILLMTQEGDLPEFTKTVTGKLRSWIRGDVKHLKAYGIGETGVLPDAQLRKVAEAINGGRNIPEVGGGKQPSDPGKNKGFYGEFAKGYIALTDSTTAKFYMDGALIGADAALKNAVENACKNIGANNLKHLTLANPNNLTCTYNNGELTVNGSSFNVATGEKKGTLTFTVKYGEGKETTLTLDIYKDASATVNFAGNVLPVTAVDSDGKIAVGRAAQALTEDVFAKKGVKVAIQVTGLTANVAGKDVQKATVNGQPAEIATKQAGSDKYVVFTIPAGVKAGTKFNLELTQVEDGKAPSVASQDVEITPAVVLKDLAADQTPSAGDGFATALDVDSKSTGKSSAALANIKTSGVATLAIGAGSDVTGITVDKVVVNSKEYAVNSGVVNFGSDVDLKELKITFNTTNKQFEVLATNDTVANKATPVDMTLKLKVTLSTDAAKEYKDTTSIKLKVKTNATIQP